MLLDIATRQPTAPSTPSLFTNHGLVLLYIAAQPGARERDIAAVVGITERSAQRIVGDLVNSGFIARRRSGRRNVYEVHLDAAALRSGLDRPSGAGSPRPGCRLPAGATARLTPRDGGTALTGRR